MKLTVLCKEDAKDLYDFELQNRTFFEQSVPGGGDAYFIYENFARILEELLAEQEAGVCYFHLIRDENGTIAGRMNLVDAEAGAGHIGYRVGEAFAGKGVASKALHFLMEIAKERYGVNRLFAKTTIGNVSSQRVLEKNGFNLVNVVDEEGVMFKHYVKHL